MSGPQPNFLFIMTDQHRADHTGFGGNEVVQTPHLDQLASEGTVFEKAYVSNPICMPNRATILTGRMPSVHGTRINGIPLDWEAETFLRVLRRDGYRTGHVGKAHFQVIGRRREEADRLRDKTCSGPARLTASAGEEDWELFERHQHEYVKLPEDYYGYQDVSLVVGHGDICSGHYYQWLLDQGVDPEQMQGRAHALQTYDGWAQIYQPMISADMYPTSYITERTIELLDGYVADEKPFFLCASYPDPHHPFTPPGAYHGMYDPNGIPLTGTFWDEHQNSAPHYQHMVKHRGEPQYRVNGWSPTPEQFRAAAAAEYGMISMIDDGVGRILRRLEDLGQLDNTVIIFTSDHGDMFGDHGLMLKHGMHYRGTTNVPLVFRIPGRQPSRVSSLVSSIDIPSTILDLAGSKPFLGMQGHSLVPLIDGGLQSVRDAVLIEEDEIFSLPGLSGPFRMRTIVTERGRLTKYFGHEYDELFDFSTDPDEMVNRAVGASSRTLHRELQDQLLDAMAATVDEGRAPAYMA